MSLNHEEQQVLQFFGSLPHYMCYSFKLYNYSADYFELKCGGELSPFFERESYFDSMATLTLDFLPEMLKNGCNAETALNAIKSLKLCINEYSDYGEDTLLQAVKDRDDSVIDFSFVSACGAITKAVRDEKTVKLPNITIEASTGSGGGSLDITLNAYAARECLSELLKEGGKYFYCTCLSFEDLLLLMQSRSRLSVQPERMG